MVTDAQALQSLLDSQPKLDGSALPPFTVEEADLDAGRVVLRFAPQPAFRNYFGHVQGGFAVALVNVLVSVAAYTRARQWLATIEIKSSFVAPMKLGECRGEASVIKGESADRLLRGQAVGGRRQARCPCNGNGCHARWTPAAAMTYITSPRPTRSPVR